MIRRPPRSTLSSSSAASDVYKRQGAHGTVEGKRVALGNASFLKEQRVDTGPLAAEAEKLRADGATAIFVGIDGKAAGVIAIADPVKASTQAAIEALRADGIRIVML